MENVFKNSEQLLSFGQGNVEAVLKAGEIWAAGVQDLGKSVTITAQAQAEQAIANMQALAGVKSFKEALELQAKLAKTSVEQATNGTSKLSDASLKLAEKVFAPINARVTLAFETFGRAA